MEEAAAIAATSLFQILLGLGSDAPPVLIASGGISIVADIFVTGPVNAALQRPLLQCIVSGTWDVFVIRPSPLRVLLFVHWLHIMMYMSCS